MIDSNAYLVWQFIATALLFIAIMLAVANIKKQREINEYFKENLELLKESNVQKSTILALRKLLKSKTDESILLSEQVHNLSENIKKNF